MQRERLVVIYFSRRSGQGKAQTGDGKNVKIYLEDAVRPYATPKGVRYESPPSQPIDVPWASARLIGRCVPDREGWFRAVSWSFECSYLAAQAAVQQTRTKRNKRRARMSA